MPEKKFHRNQNTLASCYNLLSGRHEEKHDIMRDIKTLRKIT